MPRFGNFVFPKDGIDRAFRATGIAVDTFVGRDVQHFFALVKTFTWAHNHTVGVFAAETRGRYDISHRWFLLDTIAFLNMRWQRTSLYRYIRIDVTTGQRILFFFNLSSYETADCGMPDSMNSRELFRRYLAGEEDAATDIYDRYVRRLLALARSRLGRQLQSRFDADDVVQSAYQSFFLRARNNEFQLKQSGDLWLLLAGMTINKLRRHAERHLAFKRNPASEENQADASELGDPSMGDVICLAEELSLAMASCSEDERSVLIGYLQGKDNRQLASELDKSERTIRRLLDNAKSHLEQQLTCDSPVVPRLVPIDSNAITLRYEDFRLHRLLGAGGMGKVYYATNRSTGQVVALKAIRKSRQFDVATVARFVQEAMILSKLSHPNIVRVQGLGRFPGGGLYMVMDYVEGEDLQQRIERSQLSVEQLRSIALSIAEALDHLHRHGIVHADLKPSNVIIDPSDNVVLVDFGFATLLTEPEYNTTGRRHVWLPRSGNTRLGDSAERSVRHIFLWRSCHRICWELVRTVASPRPMRRVLKSIAESCRPFRLETPTAKT